jgi:GDP-L-fucose synthase
MQKNDKILITGCQGMVGSALIKELRQLGYENVVGIDRDDCDLIDTNKTNILFAKIKPDYVFHIAAKVGGIYANDTQSAEFIYENLMIQCNVIHTAYIERVKKLIFCGSICIYPKLSPQPIKEECLLSGALEKTNIGYALAKITGVIMCQMYRKQHGCNFISVMPSNLYGPDDNFKLMDAHVLPTLIRKFHTAKINNNKSVEVWGTGIAKREFLYVKDAAQALIFLMNNYNDESPINIGTGKITSIKELAEIIKDVVKYDGEIVWNTEYTDGVLERTADISKISTLGWEAKIGLREGIEKTYQWYIYNYDFARR